jgi:ectoine hydroxylase-related dioxygenase (phytanoyl-CoA dioxygenase family)
MLSVDSKRDDDWLSLVLEALRFDGCAAVSGVLADDFLAETRARMYRVRDAIHKMVGAERLRQAGELGVLRLMPQHDPYFLRFLELPEVLVVIDHTVSSTAILHLQNGFILPSFSPGQAPAVFQNRFHMDFPRVLEGYLASVNILFAIDPFTATNGATLIAPGTHQSPSPPSLPYLQKRAVPVVCPAGSMFVFDSTLYHAAGNNTSAADRLAINHQFTRSWIKQQIDYVRALGDALVLAQKPRTQQLLGWYSRVVTSLDEYYRPEEARLYRRGQG